MKHRLASFVFLGLFLFASRLFPQQKVSYEFQEGCCVNPSFPRPRAVSKETVLQITLVRALNCATSSPLVGTSSDLAEYMDTGKLLRVAYYFGKYMPEQSGPALTIAVYSENDQRAMLLDISFDKDGYVVENIPLAEKVNHGWKVGEINGGLWSYTRLYYLAQEIGGRPRHEVTLDEIQKNQLANCWVLHQKIR